MVNTQEPLHYGHLPVYPNEWANDLCDVCSDSKVCLCVLCCFGFYNCYLHHKAGQFACQPLCCQHSLYQLRTKIRGDYRIRGSICDDSLIITLCGCCSVCQMANELKYHGIDI